jgi:hypothetical protein
MLVGKSLWPALLAAPLLVAACGEVEKAKNNAREAIVQELVADVLDDDSTFEGEIVGSPLELNRFTGKVSVMSSGKSKALGQKVEVKSGSSTLNLAPDAVNILQGVSLQIYRWDGESEIPVANPKEPPADGPFAVVAYSEVRRDNLNPSRNRDWYTYRSTEGKLVVTAVDLGDDGGIKGTAEFSVLLLDPNRPPKNLEELPLVTFTGRFNVRRSAASTLYTGQ